MRIRVSSGQSIYDVALQYYGDIEGVHDIIVKNGLEYEDDLEGGQILDVSETPINSKVVEFYTQNNIIPNNG